MRGSAGSGIGLIVACLVLAWLAASVPSARAADVTVVSHGSRERPWIALTFDDGISPDNCRRILAILVDEHVPATFFPLAEAMRLDPAFWRLVVRAGDPVGDHTLTHPRMPNLSPAAQLFQIEAARSLGEAILGRPMLRVFRPPYGAYDAETVADAGKAGFSTVLLWDVSDRDTSRRGSLRNMLAAGTRGRNGSVVLMHCGPNATPYLLRPLIASYRARGFRFVTVPKLLGLPWATAVTTPPSPSEILDGLSALPPSSSDGPITGPNGYVPPSATPVPSSAVPPTPSPAPTSAGPTSRVASGSLPLSESGSPGEPATSGGPSEAVGAPSTPETSGTLDALLIGLLVVSASAGVLVLLVRRRGRPGE